MENGNSKQIIATLSSASNPAIKIILNNDARHERQQSTTDIKYYPLGVLTYE